MKLEDVKLIKKGTPIVVTQWRPPIIGYFVGRERVSKQKKDGDLVVFSRKRLIGAIPGDAELCTTPRRSVRLWDGITGSHSAWPGKVYKDDTRNLSLIPGLWHDLLYRLQLNGVYTLKDLKAKTIYQVQQFGMPWVDAHFIRIWIEDTGNRLRIGSKQAPPLTGKDKEKLAKRLAHRNRDSCTRYEKLNGAPVSAGPKGRTQSERVSEKLSKDMQALDDYEARRQAEISSRIAKGDLPVWDTPSGFKDDSCDDTLLLMVMKSNRTVLRYEPGKPISCDFNELTNDPKFTEKVRALVEDALSKVPQSL